MFCDIIQLNLASPAILSYRICLDNGDRTVNQGFLLVTCIPRSVLVFRIVSQDLVAYIFKRAREYKQCTSRIESNIIWTLFRMKHSRVRSLVFLLFFFCCFLEEARPFIHILFYY